MQRRDFFKSLMEIPLKKLTDSLKDDEPSEAELFMEAMGYGIDPATLSPAELKKAVNRKRQEANRSSPPPPRAAPS